MSRGSYYVERLVSLGVQHAVEFIENDISRVIIPYKRSLSFSFITFYSSELAVSPFNTNDPS